MSAVLVAGYVVIVGLLLGYVAYMITLILAKPKKGDHS